MITVITGGSRSGKSAFAEKLLNGKDDAVYIATAAVTDDEMKARVQKHIARRNPKWRTYEGYRNLEKAIGDEQYYLLDCVTNLISRILFDETGTKETITAEDTQRTIAAALTELHTLLDGIQKRQAEIILVTNEVGSSIVPMHPLSRCFSDVQGIVNAKLAERADTVFITVCGLPLKLK